jgi:hypothetical protein
VEAVEKAIQRRPRIAQRLNVPETYAFAFLLAVALLDGILNGL